MWEVEEWGQEKSAFLPLEMETLEKCVMTPYMYIHVHVYTMDHAHFIYMYMYIARTYIFVRPPYIEDLMALFLVPTCTYTCIYMYSHGNQPVPQSVPICGSMCALSRVTTMAGKILAQLCKWPPHQKLHN